MSGAVIVSRRHEHRAVRPKPDGMNAHRTRETPPRDDGRQANHGDCKGSPHLVHLRSELSDS
jgi:hypothetical protein